MTFIKRPEYSLPGGDQPLSHARIAHSGNWLSGGTFAVSSIATGYFIGGPNNSLTYEKWKPASLPAVWEYHHGADAECDYCVIGAHTLGSTGCSVQAQYWDGAAWQNASPFTAIVTNAPIYILFEPETGDKWRVAISGSTEPEIGIVKFGKALQMERPIYGAHAPLDYQRQTVTRSTESESGEFLGRTKQRVGLRTTYEWIYLTEAWVAANWKPLQLAIEEEPFFIAWRPSDYGDVGLCLAGGAAPVSFSGTRTLMSGSLNVTGYGYD